MNNPVEIVNAEKVKVEIGPHILSPVSPIERTDYTNEPEASSESTPAPNLEVIAEIVENPVTDKLTASYILEIVSNNAFNAFKDVSSKSASTPMAGGVVLPSLETASRVAEGVVEVAGKVKPVADLSKYAVAGLCVAGVGSAAAAWPALVGIAAVSAILAEVSIIMQLNRELNELITIVNSQIQRIYNIYCVIEEISKENAYSINTEMIKKYLIIIFTNILLVSGQDTYIKIKRGIGKNVNIKDLEVSGNSKSAAPGHSHEVGFSFFSYLFGQKKARVNNANLNSTAVDFESAMNDEKKNQWFNRVINWAHKVTDTKEILRGISRDLLLLNVYFSILQSEFDLLARARVEQDKIAYLNEIELAEKEPSLELKINKLLSIAKLQTKVNSWPNGETYKTFVSQLPKSNISVLIIEKLTGQSVEEIVSSTTPQVISENSKTESALNNSSTNLYNVVYKPRINSPTVNDYNHVYKAESNSTAAPAAPSSAPATIGGKKRYTLRKSRNQKSRNIYSMRK